MNRQTIYIAAYPKSGSTYLTRLLGDVLNSPTGGCMPQEDNKEVATEGQDRPGKYIVRKGHFTILDINNYDGLDVVPHPHKMATWNITDELIVFLHRDPRDICVSGAYHWLNRVNQNAVSEFLNRMIKGDIAKCGRWDNYCQSWLECEQVTFETSYRDLLEDTFNEIKWCLSYLGAEMPYDNWINQAIERQSFKVKSQGMTNSEKRRNNMRKGIVGDWRNYFTDEMNDLMWDELGWMMEKLGYEYR